MIDREAILRIARPTDNLQLITEMYIKGLGFKLLGEFKNHQGFDGVIIGHPKHNYHLEFTHHVGTKVGSAPTQDNLLVFYIADADHWESACAQLIAAGFKDVPSYNPYWDVKGKTFEDVDLYRVVLQNSEWSI